MNEYFYETGSTQPPGSRFPMVILLVLVIFSSGIITALGILNISLWRTFSPEEEAVSLQFTREELPAADPLPTSQSDEVGLGVETETVSPFIQAYYSLPQGVYIPRVPDGSNAAAAGILSGDILLALDGQQITDTESLSALLRHYQAGDTVALTIYRDKLELSVNLTLERP